MGRLPKEKLTLSIYVTPRCKEKLECLQQLYNIAGKTFSLSKVVEDSIHLLYNIAYFCQDSVAWRGFAKIIKAVEPSDSLKEGIDEVLSVTQEKKHAVKEVLTVKLNFKESLVNEIKSMFSGIKK